MPGYTSIKEDVLKKLKANLPEMRERFGIETIGIFGSVSPGEDIPLLISQIENILREKKKNE